MKREGRILGLTGGLASGKSEALRCFAQAGAWTLSMDALHHELSKPGGPVYRAILRVLGRAVLRPDGTLDRPRLAERAFSHARTLARLERASHPILLRELRRRLARRRAKTAVVDAAILFEKGWQEGFDAAIVVEAPRGVRLARAVRRGMSRRDALRRLRSQWTCPRRRALADMILFNDGSLPQLRRAVRDCLQSLEGAARMTYKNTEHK
ncbi:MAG: dephospho-CoA kinase [Elusimicrobiota bacterium]|jgi:dephospho-CoA kinase